MVYDETICCVKTLKEICLINCTFVSTEKKIMLQDKFVRLVTLILLDLYLSLFVHVYLFEWVCQFDYVGD